MDIRKGDTVQIISGNDKGRRSTVLSVLKGNARVIVEGVNMRKHHTRPSARDPQGGIVERHLSTCPTSWSSVPRVISRPVSVIRSSKMANTSESPRVAGK